MLWPQLQEARIKMKNECTRKKKLETEMGFFEILESFVIFFLHALHRTHEQKY